jgi:acylphosphatase
VAERVVAHALVSGRVQGVGFRWHTHDTARALGVSGCCANLADGRVEVWCEGEAAQVERLLAWLHHGPSAARVEGVVVERGTQAVALADKSARRAF